MTKRFFQDMAIFPPSVPHYNNTLFDNVMNYGCGSLLITIALASLSLNAFVFCMCFERLPLRAPNIVLMVLSASDFLFTAVRAPSVAYNLLNPHIKAGVPNQPPKLQQSIPDVLACITAYTSISAVFGLSIK